MGMNKTHMRAFKYVHYVFWLFLLCIKQVSAYLDPSVMTYTIQTIAGVVIALSTFFGLYWQKLLKLFRKSAGERVAKYETFESDDISFRDPEQNGKIMKYCDYHFDFLEPSVASPTVNEETNGEATIVYRNLKQEEAPRSLKEILFSCLPGLLLVVAFFFMLVVYAPIEMFWHNIGEFWFTYDQLKTPVMQLFQIMSVIGILVVFLANIISKKVYNVFLVFATIVFLTFYIHGNFMVSNLPVMDGKEIVWEEYFSDQLASIVVILIISLIMIVLYKKLKNQTFYNLVSFISVLISGMLIVSLISIVSGNKNNLVEERKKYQATVLNELDYSSTDNFIVFIVDAVDETEWSQMLEEYPEYEEVFRDFTYFPDTLATYPYTTRAVPYMLSGVLYENEIDYIDWVAKAMDNSPLLKRLKTDGYTVGLYDSSLMLYSSDYSNYENYVLTNVEISSDSLFKKYLLDMAWFKYAPFNLKKYSEFNIDNFGTLKVADASIKVDNWRNETFLKRLEDGMTLNDSKKYFKFIHTKGAHLPFDMSEDIVRLGTENKAYTTYYNQVRGTAKLLAEYLQDLKELGVYDDSVIVLLSDHGYSPSNKEPKDRQNPMLMVKGKNEQHDFQRSYDVVSHAD